MDLEPKLISLISQYHSLKDTMNSDPDSYSSMFISVTTQIISLVNSVDSDLEPETELMSLISRTVDCFKSMDLDSQPDPLRKLISLIYQKFNSSDWKPDRELRWESEPESDSETEWEPESDSETEWEPESKTDHESELISLVSETLKLEPLPELLSLIQKIMSLVDSIYTKPELKLKSLVTQLIFVNDPVDSKWNYVLKFISLCIQIVSIVRSLDLDSQPKPESELMSLTTQLMSVFNSMDLDSQSEPLRKLISLASRRSSFINFRDSDSELEPDMYREFLDLLDEKSRLELERDLIPKKLYVDYFLHSKLFLLIAETLSLEPEPKLISLTHQIFSLVMSMNSKWKKLTSFCPQVQVILKEGKFHVIEEGSWRRNDKWDCLESSPIEGRKNVNRKVSWKYHNKWDCLPLNWQEFRLSGEEDNTHFLCRGCYGENHKENNKALVETKHPLHPKHSLQLALMKDGKNRQCYYCDKVLGSLFFYCSACDFGIKFTCAKKPRVLSINRPKWHEHTLVLFQSQAPLTCSLCALTHSKCPFYICPPCDFVVHQRLAYHVS